jgi:hypothetical protein
VAGRPSLGLTPPAAGTLSGDWATGVTLGLNENVHKSHGSVRNEYRQCGCCGKIRMNIFRSGL